MTNDDDRQPKEAWFTKPMPKIVQGWIVFAVLLMVNAGAWFDPATAGSAADALFVQFVFLGAAWFFGGHFMSGD